MNEAVYEGVSRIRLSASSVSLDSPLTSPFLRAIKQCERMKGWTSEIPTIFVQISAGQRNYLPVHSPNFYLWQAFVIKTTIATGSYQNTKTRSKIGITTSNRFSRTSQTSYAMTRRNSAVPTIITGRNASPAPHSNVASTENVK